MLQKKEIILEPYRQGIEQVAKSLNTSRKSGLSDAEVTSRQNKYGLNRLEIKGKDPLILKYFRQYKDLMIVLLTASAAVSAYLGDSRTAIVLIVIVLLNTLLGFFQEFKAEKLMESLERLVVQQAKVVRESKLISVDSVGLVPGDIVYVEAGDSVPADLRLLEESELSTNDFALTGESNPSRKFTHAISNSVELANRHNLLFMGTTVATGNAFGVVVGTGMNTELGRIASLSQQTVHEVSPLQKEMNHTATRVTQGTVILCSILLPVAIQTGLPFKDAFLYAIGIASSLIPQGLPAEINTSLAQAANKLAKAKALVKKLSAVETLGATSIICTDKTGTLTKNEMTVTQFTIGHDTYLATGTGYETNGEITDLKGKKLSKEQLAELELFFSAGVFASNASVNPPDHEHQNWYCRGDPTEGALITLADKAGLPSSDLNDKHPELKEYSFDSARKRMTSFRRFGRSEDDICVFTKGAPENVLERCEYIWDGKTNHKLTPEIRADILEQNEALAKKAMRNLGYAYKKLPPKSDPNSITMDSAESELIWLGLVSMQDPLRDEVPAALEAAEAAHIKVSIITGDFALTAKAIAEKAGLGKGVSRSIEVVSGEDLRKLDDAKVLALVTQGDVIFSRVSPEDKLRIVELVKNSGKVVAVTGDGINDAPALKRADIGVAMGRTGTDVAMQSADIVLLDDSFHTLVSAVQQGRVIFHNIKKSTLCAFTSNTGELVVNLCSLAAASFFNIPLALSVMQILAIDLVAELFPIAALGWDPADSDVMVEQPRSTKKHIMDRNNILDLLWCGVLIGGLAFLNYLWLFSRQGVSPQYLASGSAVHLQATSLTYLTIVICQLGNIIQRRSKHGIFTRYQFNNRHFWFAICLSLFCVANIIYNPWIAPYFQAGPLDLIDWVYALGAAIIFLTIREAQRLFMARREKPIPAYS